MRFTIYLIVICALYYYYYCNYNPSPTNNYYFVGFVSFYVLSIYLYNYQKPFAYKLTRNIYNSDKYPLHEMLPDYKKKNEKKEELILKQYGRCHNCQMKLHPRFEDEYKIMFIIPLNQGGPYEPYNLKVVCPNCYRKSNLR
jgi:hypothetical protein